MRLSVPCEVCRENLRCEWEFKRRRFRFHSHYLLLITNEDWGRSPLGNSSRR